MAGYSGPAPSVAASAPAPGPSAPKGKNKGKDASSVWCFFCLVKGHYASTCTKRSYERSKNIWRPTIRCPHMSRDAFYKLSREEKNIGRNMVNSSSTSVSASAVAASSLTNNNRSFREVAGGIGVREYSVPGARGLGDATQEDLFRVYYNDDSGNFPNRRCSRPCRIGHYWSGMRLSRLKH